MEQVIVANDHVEQEIKKRGKPVKQKPHGSGHTALLYEAKSEAKDDPKKDEKPKDTSRSNPPSK